MQPGLALLSNKVQSQCQRYSDGLHHNTALLRQAQTVRRTLRADPPTVQGAVRDRWAPTAGK